MEPTRHISESMMNRASRRAEARKNGTAMHPGRQDGSESTHKVVFHKKLCRSSAKIPYLAFTAHLSLK